MGELGALFNPGMRHEQEERRAKALIREEEGDSREVDPRIDLESGVAVITTDDDENSGRAAAAHDMSPADRSTQVSTTASEADPAVDGDEPAATPPRPRPRGKRSLTSGTR